MKGKLIVISGPSGVGKDTICEKLVKESNYEYSISMTTRKPRTNEINGVNYYFVTEKEFKQKIKQQYFLEYAIYNNNYYGTPKEKILEKINKGVNVILKLEIKGARNIKKMYPDALFVYILPPSIKELKERLINRNENTIEDIKNRIKIAKEEIKQADFYDYKLINDKLDEIILQIKKIVL